MNIRMTLAACALLAVSAASAEEQPAPLSGNKLDAKHGAEVYRSACASCHDQGKGAAPRLDKPESWKNRSFESFSVLNAHARKGFLTMPAKGRRPLLSDQDVADAVFYMTQRLEGVDAERLDAVAKRGASVMPFDLDKTTHVFDKTKQGGIQQVVAKQGSDAEQIRLIRHHLAVIAGQFAHGDFSAPTRIHGADMPGLAELKQAPPGSLKVKYGVLERGAQIEYSATDPALVCAIHRWFDAQLSDHARHATGARCDHHSHHP